MVFVYSASVVILNFPLNLNLIKIFIDWLIDIIFLAALTEHMSSSLIFGIIYIIKTLLPSFRNKYHSLSLEIKRHCEQFPTYCYPNML